MTTSTLSVPQTRAGFGTPGNAYWLLRLGAASCFIGHGAFGFITKAAWLPYFAVAGIPASWAWKLMPLIGAVDVLAAMAVLFAPRGAPLLYMALWASWTAVLRPLAGESVWEAVERAGNYGVPFALLVMTGIPRTLSDLRRTRLDVDVVDSAIARVCVILRCTTAALLFGHGALAALMGKATLVAHFAAVGLSPRALQVVGFVEMAAAIAVAMRPSIAPLILIAVWKIASESLWLVTGAPVWEFVERGGSYAAPLALAALLAWQSSRNTDR
jgi:hypothetical protein